MRWPGVRATGGASATPKERRRRRGRRERERRGDDDEGDDDAEEEERGQKGGEAVPKFLSKFVPDYENTVLYIFFKGVDLRERNSPNVMESIAR